MPDISMCRNARCHLRYDCYRYMAVPNPMRQAYAGFAPKDDGDCVAWWPLDEDMKLNEELLKQKDVQEG